MPPKRTATPLVGSPAQAISAGGLLAAAFFGPSWATWRVVLRAAHAEPLDEAELALFRSVAGERSPPRHRVRELIVIAGRRSGKDSIASAIATIAAIADHGARLRPGERASVLCLAVDREQARIVHRYVAGYFREIPLLRPLIARETDDGVELVNNAEIVIATNNYRSVRGRTVACAIFDEAAFWKDETTASPDIETYNAILPATITLPGAILVIITTAYRRAGLAYQKWHAHFGKDDDDVLVVYGPSTAFNPSLPQSVIDAALARDPEAAGAEWLSQWRSDLSDFLDRELIEAAVDHGVAVRPPRPGVQYTAAADPSGGRGDSFTVAISHAEGNLVILDALYEKRAPFDPGIVVAEAAELLRHYGCATLTGDNFGAEWVVEAFAKVGIRYHKSERDRSACYIELLPLFTTGRMRLLDHQRLVHQFICLERRTSRIGKDRVNHPPGGADDLCNAAAIALVLAASEAAPALIRERDLVPTDPPATLGRVIEFYAVLWICGDGIAAWAIFAKPANTNKPLIIVDFERCPWHARMTDDIASQLDGLCENAGLGHAAASAWFYAPEALTRVADRSMCNAFAQRATRADAVFRRIAVEAISPKMLADPMKLVFSAHARTGTGKVQLAASALVKTRTAPLFGSLALRPGERVDDDPLRVVLLVGIVSAFEVAR